MIELSLSVRCLAAFGILLGLAFSLAIRVDEWLVERGRRTISERLLALGLHHHVAAFAICFAFTIVFDALAGHLFYPVEVQSSLPVFAILGAVLGTAGFYIGHRFFGQRAG